MAPSVDYHPAQRVHCNFPFCDLPWLFLGVFLCLIGFCDPSIVGVALGVEIKKVAK